MRTPAIAHAALLGAATGLRSFTPVAALVLRGGNRWTRTAVTAAALGELVADKLPQTPSRLRAPALAGRVVLGAVAGGLYAHRRHVTPIASALVGAVAAVAGSHAGTAWRRRTAGSRLTVPAALLEDAVAVAVAVAAAPADRHGSPRESPLGQCR